MIQVRGETRRILRRGGSVAGGHLAPGVARRAALLIAVWMACVCTAGADNLNVMLKANEKEPIEAIRVLFENGNLQIVLPSGVRMRRPVSALLCIEPKERGAADEVKRLREDNANLRDENTTLTKKLQERENELGQYKKAFKNDASLDKETARSIQARDMEDLKKAKEGLTAELQAKDATIARLNKTVEEAQARLPPPTPALEIAGTSLSTTTLRGVVRVQGEIRNKDQVPYSRVVLEVLVRDSGNKLLGKTHTFVTALQPGAARTFTADLELDAKEGMKSEVTAVAAKTTGGEWKK